MAAPLFERVIAQGPKLTQLLQERSAHLAATGWPAPLEPTPDTYLFYVTDETHVRCPYSYAGTLRRPDGSVETLDPALIPPERISPKAALRAIFQDYVLPTVAYVAGPGELDYHAQLGPLYAALDVSPPVLFPRLSATLLDGRTRHLMEKTGLSVDRLLTEDKHALTKELLAKLDGHRTTAIFEESHREIETVFARIRGELAALDPTLEGAARTAAGKALFPLTDLRQKAEKSLRQKHSTELARIEKTLAVLKPFGKLSERVFCTASALVRFGLEPLLAGLDQLPADGKEHHIMTLEA
jgi:uncharacterized protein YllA (UPF0747 family)